MHLYTTCTPLGFDCWYTSWLLPPNRRTHQHGAFMVLIVRSEQTGSGHPMHLLPTVQSYCDCHFAHYTGIR